jgi:hypothetical protein
MAIRTSLVAATVVLSWGQALRAAVPINDNNGIIHVGVAAHPDGLCARVVFSTEYDLKNNGPSIAKTIQANPAVNHLPVVLTTQPILRRR